MNIFSLHNNNNNNKIDKIDLYIYLEICLYIVSTILIKI